MKRALLLGACCALRLLCSTEATSEAEPWIAPPHLQFQYLANNRYRFRTLPAEAADPVAGLTAEEAQNLASGKVQARDLLPAFLDRIEAQLIQSAALSAEQAQWLAAQPALRRSFFLALDPFLDHPAQAIAVLQRLRDERPGLCERLPQLAVAAAVVFDSEVAQASARYFLLWGVEEQQWPPLPDYLEIIDLLADPANKTLVLRPEKLVWPLLVHVVDCDLPAEERAWALQQFTATRATVHNLYGKVRYDYDKLQGHPALGDLPYTLANVLDPRYGGVCVDQAHLTARVMKLFGIPAVKARGDSRYGGVGHAWTCYLTFQKQWGWTDTGRYNFDNYWTGTIFDPQRETLFSDRALMMDLDGAVRSFSAFEDARALARMAAASFAQYPEASWKLTQTALARNPFCSEAWRMFLGHLGANRISDSSVQAHVRLLLRQLTDHPDVTLAVLCRIVDRIDPSDLKRRLDLYSKAQSLYTERPDLQLRLAQIQAVELFQAGLPSAAVEIAVSAFDRNAAEGTLCLPLVTMIVEECLARDAKTQKRAYDALNTIAQKKFPQRRGQEISQAWLDLNALLKQLVP